MTELVEITFVGDEHQAAMIQALLEQNGIPSLQEQVAPSGPQLGYALMNFGGGARRVMVHAHRAEEARAVLDEALANGEDLPEPVNARYLEEGQSGGKRLYGTRGALARLYLFIFGLMALTLGGFLVARALGLT